MLAVHVGQRQLPDGFARRGRRILDLLYQRVVVAQDRRDAASKGDDLRAGEGGASTIAAGFLRRERQRVGQNQTALGVGVEHFHRHAVASAQHVARLDRLRPRHVLGARGKSDDRVFTPSAAHAAVAFSTAAAPPMSVFIVSMPPLS